MRSPQVEKRNETGDVTINRELALPELFAPPRKGGRDKNKFAAYVDDNDGDNRKMFTRLRLQYIYMYRAKYLFLLFLLTSIPCSFVYRGGNTYITVAIKLIK